MSEEETPKKKRKIVVKAIAPLDVPPPGWAEAQKEYRMNAGLEGEKLICVHLIMDEVEDLAAIQKNIQHFNKVLTEAIGYSPVVLTSRASDGITLQFFEETDEPESKILLA